MCVIDSSEISSLERQIHIHCSSEVLAKDLVFRTARAGNMARPLPTHRELHYNKVELFKTETLGVGSYGVVCKARCDELPCAAKLLHPVMFQFNDPGALAFLRKFEQECQFLHMLTHPNIVQYIATSRDPETGLPVLLMELMDESLTSFLEQSQQPLPYHTQVNLSHDIALALAYLHSNEIVHRDLSSNNVLLIARSRAKVTDFGMSKLMDTNPRMTPLTKCPGMVVYMSPEALRDPPVYSKKLDCFSEGVLIIQIITRQFPNPGPAMKMIQDPRYPHGRVHVEVPEIERRRSHVDLIDPTHPLLPSALRCLEYNEDNRPSAKELCHRLATLKETLVYNQSMQQATVKTIEAETEERERLIREQLQTSIQTLQEQVQEKDRQLQAEVQEKHRQLQAKDTIINEKEQENRQIRQQLQGKDRVIEARERQLHELNQQLQENQRMVTELEERLSEKDGLVQQLQQQLRISEYPSTKQRSSRKHTELKWKSSRIQHGVNYIQPAVDGKTAFFKSNKTLLAYDSSEEKWSELPQCLHDDFALTVISSLLTAAGGTDKGSPTNKLLSLIGTGSEGKWEERFPPMPTKRFFATALCTGRHLTVIGGKTMTIITTQVEVMNMDTLQWSVVGSLPYPVYLATATFCGGDVYVLGGYDKPIVGSRSVFRCSLNALLQSCDSYQVWQQVASPPVTYSACTTLHGRVLAIGGEDSSRKSTTAIYEYNPATNSWEVVSHMPTPCYACPVAVLPGNRLMAVAGSRVQIGSLQ